MAYRGFLLALGLAATAFADSTLLLNVENKVRSLKTLGIARGSSGCWGIPGLEPQMNGSFIVRPDERNLACPCHGSAECDYSSVLIVGLNYDFNWDFTHKMEEHAGDIKFVGHGKNVSGALKWTYSCHALPSSDSYKISIDRPSTNEFKVTIESAKVDEVVV
eukprot:CAMPEP_0197889152 /NCGR_PEP_ID=MMETSP1439-20131203/23601_1 /TAXON_ID=66791 /ORGANISM="Gonyaulax spinifera, Strain CCMP409" /LENGTH=161 /DNA_ID=CAMNT_0043509107 /DNA_START=64 /DNA_END=549 /DNA_ORIENTATION=+